MKLAWICYPYGDDDDDDPVEPTLLFTEPPRYLYGRIIPIVYAELKE